MISSNRNVLLAQWNKLDTSGEAYVRISHLLNYFYQFKGSLLLPETTLLMILNELDESYSSGFEVLHKIQSVVTFDDFTFYWCRLSMSKIWNHGDMEALSTHIADHAEDSKEDPVSESPATLTSQSPSLQQNLMRLFQFLSSDSIVGD